MTTVPTEPVAAPEPRWRALRGTNLADRLYRTVLTTLALLLPLLLLALVGELVVSAWPAIQRFGGTFLWTSVWDPVAGVFGDRKSTRLNPSPSQNSYADFVLRKKNTIESRRV